MRLAIRCNCGLSLDSSGWTKEPVYTVEPCEGGMHCPEDTDCETGCSTSYANCPNCKLSYDWQPCTF